MVYDYGGKKLQRGFDFGILKMAAVTMETAKIWKTSKCFKFNETYNKCCLAYVDLTFEFGIFKMAAVTMETANCPKFQNASNLMKLCKNVTGHL